MTKLAHSVGTTSMVLLCHPSVAAIPSLNVRDPLVTLGPEFGPRRARVRSILAARLIAAQQLLPEGVSLLVAEGHREASMQQRIIERYSAEIALLHPGMPAAQQQDLTSRFVAPMNVAPHVAGAAVDITLADASGRQLDMGTEIDATPEQSAGACYFDSPTISAEARENRELLGSALTAVGYVNYPSEWWHWSFGDKYWALRTGATAALFGPVGMDASAGPK